MTGKPIGIPTLYKGVQFRSRIEAKWAAMFDKLGWEWEYEPLDLAGYIPDFILPFKFAPFLVEVKAAVDVPAELEQNKPKIVQSMWDGEAAIVGGRLVHHCAGEVVAGLFGARTGRDGEAEWFWDHARMFWCVPCRGYSLQQTNGLWRCPRCGVNDGNQGEANSTDIHEMWNAAGNDVQWKGPRL